MINKIVNFLIYDLNWTWLEFILSGLCELEMQLRLIFDKKLRHYINSADTIFVSEGQEKSYSEQFIPKKTFYCEECIYQDVLDWLISFSDIKVLGIVII